MIEQTALSGFFGGGVGFVFYTLALEAGWSQFAASNALLLFFVLFENVQTYNCRSETRSTFRIPLRDNVILVFAVFGAQALHILAMHLPGVSTIIDAGPVSLGVWLGMGALAISTVALMEGYKFLGRRAVRRGTISQ
jgi:magnesium-transporting ATPase (P-type)